MDKKTRTQKSPRLLKAVVFLLLTLGTFSTPQSHAADILIDDFDDGTRSPNSLDGFTGSFINEDQVTHERFAFCADQLSEGGMALEFSRDARPESFCGFFSQMGPGASIDLTTAGVNQLSFKVRGDLIDGAPGGGHNFQIEIKDSSGKRLMTALANAPGFEAGTVQGELRQVDIPFSAMRPDGGPIDLSSVKEVAIAFNREFTAPNAPVVTSKILIDDLKFTRREDPPPSILESDPASLDIDLIARASVIASGPSNAQIMTVAEDPGSLRGTALKLYHDLTDSGDFFAFFVFPSESPVDLAGEGIRTVKIRMRKTGFDSAPLRVVLELKKKGEDGRLSEVVGTVLSYGVGQGSEGTEYAETIFPIYSESPVIDGVVLVYSDGGDGALLVDKLTLSTDPYIPNSPPYLPSAGPARSDEELLDYIESQSARYFVDQLVGSSFHVRDRSAPDSASSIAATAFALSTFTVMSRRYDPTPGSLWDIVDRNGITITPAESASRVKTLLDQFLAIQAAQPDVNTGEGDPDRLYGIAGFFYHFLNEDGTRARDSEVSVIDTAILLTAAIQAGEYFGGEIREKAERLLSNVNWNYMFYEPEKAFRLSWLPLVKRGFSIPDPGGIGFLSDGTVGRPTDELLLVNILALASDPLNVAFQQALYSYPRVERIYRSRNNGNFPVVNSFFGSAFTYLYAHLYFDFDLLGPDRPGLITADLEFPDSVDWWINSVNAFRANRQFAIDRSEHFPFSFHENSWGISAVERPDGKYEGLYGGSPAENGPTHDGTVAVHIPFSALTFFKESSSELLGENEAFQAMRFAYDHFYDDLFGPYGPVDSYNDRAEFSDFYLGLDQGPIVLSIENYRSGLILNTFMRNTQIQAACAIAFGHAPVINPVADQTVEAGNHLSFNLTATDADGDGGLEILSSNLPDGASLVNDGTGMAAFNWTPEISDVGNHVVGFTVRDAYRDNPEPVFVSIKVETPPDTEPHVFFRTPEPGAVLTGVVHIEAASSDPVHTRLGILYVDGRRIAWTYGAEAAYDLQTAFFANGPRTFKARFYHTVLMRYLEAELIFDFQNSSIIARSIKIIQPQAGAILSGEILVAVETNDPQQTALYQVYVDGRRMAGRIHYKGPFTIDTRRFADGMHAITVRAYDRFSAEFLADQVQVEFDNFQPMLQIVAPAHNAAVSGRIQIQAEAEPGKFVVLGRLFVDGKYTARDLWSPFTFTVDTTALSNGPHQFRVTAFAFPSRETPEQEITLNVQK
ncbi:MAG: hypothetical protein HY587_05580 [Candidatus Omnitrophica bacterium]|nr:hypothetical protein [Candidatus Omnitrophota bacterium]